MVPLSPAHQQHKISDWHCSQKTNWSMFCPHLMHEAFPAQSYQPQSDVPCLHCPEPLIFLIFQIAGSACPKTKWEREHESGCDRRRHGRRGDIFYCHYVCWVLTRWQCSVGILFDKFDQTWHHFKNFLSVCVCVCWYNKKKCNNCSKLGRYGGSVWAWPFGCLF